MENYAACTYNKSKKPYTFYTDIITLVKNDKVLVYDANGFNICTFQNYVTKMPDFKTRNILEILSVKDLKNIDYYHNDTKREKGLN